MSAISEQDRLFIQFIRTWATTALGVADAGVEANGDWNGMYGGGGRLDSFTGDDEGLDKDDIGNAKSVLYALNAWLDEGGYSRRTYLLTVCYQNPG